MKAVVYEGPRKVGVTDVLDARIERPTDVLVRITSSNICGSDLHLYEGRTDFEPGRHRPGITPQPGRGSDRGHRRAQRVRPGRGEHRLGATLGVRG
ncbi:hypothetical protein GCM10009539_04910 [Cryptosporangium japonicum]|uniref:Uncharacterized protein n=1 Tax=Cryptosporangium japonicum TaxID=80872 RepID=A0ABP3D3V8_9ACTN